MSQYVEGGGTPNGTLKRQHVLVVEKVLGKPLPKGAIVHHVDGNGKNNAHNNLVVCQDQAYHLLLHQRQRALDACGNPSFRICSICKKYDDLQNLKEQSGRRGGFVHRQCTLVYAAKRRAKMRSLGLKWWQNLKHVKE